ncbi:MAG: Gfo/Idh/MocA family oxidoreductase [Clostridiales bacterium]|nr:Gfo/Idh/MocA family oxidoreductase [Clostridiales bacterium]
MKNVAIIGYGGQGAWHAEQILKSDVCVLSGVYDIKEERRIIAKEKGIKVYSDNAEIFNDKSVDIVVIATPNDSHKDLAIEAFKHKKHVICEKPVETSVKNLKKMIEASKKHNCIFTVHQNRRWDIDFLAVKSVIESCEIGEPINIESRVHGSRGIPSDWRCQKESGGGMMLDWGVHLIDQMLQLFKEKVVSVYCKFTHILNNEVDDGFKLVLGFEGGKTALIEVGTYNFISLPRFYIQCKQGTLKIEDWRQNAHIAKLKAWQEKDIMPVVNAAGITKTMAPRDEITLSEYDIDKPTTDVHNFYRNICYAIDKKEECLIKLEEVQRVMAVMEKAFVSDKRGQVIKTEI